MNKKWTAILLSAFVLPGLGQLYLGRKMAGGIIIVIINILLLLALFVLIRALSPVIADKIAGGAITITSSEVIISLEGASLFGKAVLASFCAVWLFSIIDILKQNSNN